MHCYGALVASINNETKWDQWHNTSHSEAQQKLMPDDRVKGAKLDARHTTLDSDRLEYGAHNTYQGPR